MFTDKANPAASAISTVPETARSPAGTVASAELLRGQREVLIRHGEETYRLRLTRNGKLILHK